MSLPIISDIFYLDPLTEEISTPPILLTTKAFKPLGYIKYTNWNFSFVAAGMDEITFDVYKPAPITDDLDAREKLALTYEHKVWDNLVDLKLIEIKDYGRFEIAVNYTDNTKTMKSIHAISLECELSKLKLFDFHVNDEDAMSSMEITEYNKGNFDSEGNFIPTTLCNFSDQAHSLVHRVLKDKAPHWKIGNQEEGTGYFTPYVSLGEDEYAELSKRFQRTYTCNGDSIYDFLTNTVANECNVVFVFDTLNRVINCYSLCDCILKSNGETVASSVGSDTNVFISKEKLANEITITSKKDEVTNCYRVEGGDDVITAMVSVATVNGTNYIMQFSDIQYDDMSDDLVAGLKSYQQALKDAQPGYEEIYLDLCEAYDNKNYKESEMMPSVTLEETSAQEEYQYMISQLRRSDFFIGVQTDYTASAHTGVTNKAIDAAQVLVHSNYKVSVVGDTSYTVVQNSDYIGQWTGSFRVTNTLDESEFYPRVTDTQTSITLKVTKDPIAFSEQKIEMALKKGDMLEVKFDLDDSKYLNSDGTINESAVYSYFNQYNLTSLNSFYDGYETCLSILMEMGQSDVESDKYQFYLKYLTIRNVIKKVKDERQKEVDLLYQQINELNQKRVNYQSQYNLENYFNAYFGSTLGHEKYLEFCAYRREDTYSNSNYISDGLDDEECLKKAKELVDVATKEINKACMLQRTLSSDLNNLYALEEFRSFHDKFALFNYIRLATEDEILKLRLIGIDINGSSLSNISVTFSDQIESVDGAVDDLQSIIDQANGINSSYPATIRQAKKGEEAKKEIGSLKKNGLDAAKMLITNSNSNEVTYGGFGILCKNQGDTGDYGMKQLRMIGNGLYLTDDAWETVKMAIGQILVGDQEKYGIIADTIIAGTLVDSTGENYWNLETGEFHSGSIDSSIDDFKTTVSDTYVTKDGLKVTEDSIIDQVENKINMSVSTTVEGELEGINGEINSIWTQLEKFFEFSDDGLIIKSSITTKDAYGNEVVTENPYKMRLDNDRLILTYNGQPVLWLKDSDSSIPSLYVTEMFNLFGYSITEDDEGRVNCEYVGGGN